MSTLHPSAFDEKWWRTGLFTAAMSTLHPSGFDERWRSGCLLPLCRPCIRRVYDERWRILPGREWPELSGGMTLYFRYCQPCICRGLNNILFSNSSLFFWWDMKDVFRGENDRPFRWGRMRDTMFCWAFSIDSTNRPFLIMRERLGERMTELSGSRMKGPLASTRFFDLASVGFQSCVIFSTTYHFSDGTKARVLLCNVSASSQFFCWEPSKKERCRNLR